MSNEIDVHMTKSEFRFSKNAIVILPTYIRRQTSGGVVKGIIQGDTPYWFEDNYYWPVQIKPPALPRYRKPIAGETLFVKEDDLRLDVAHSSCPSCRCLTEEAKAALALEDDYEEKEEEDEDEEPEEEEEEEPFRT